MVRWWWWYRWWCCCGVVGHVCLCLCVLVVGEGACECQMERFLIGGWGGYRDKFPPRPIMFCAEHTPSLPACFEACKTAK